jgi:hypothetical protein
LSAGGNSIRKTWSIITAPVNDRLRSFTHFDFVFVGVIQDYRSCTVGAASGVGSMITTEESGAGAGGVAGDIKLPIFIMVSWTTVFHTSLGFLLAVFYYFILNNFFL